MAMTNTASAKPSTISESIDDNQQATAQGIGFYYKLITLYLLNIVDWLCTEALISTGRFFEANPFMKSVLEDFWLTVIIKGVLPLALVLLCAIIYRLMNTEAGVVANTVLLIGIIAYAVIIVWHILNFVLLFSYF